MRGLWFGLMVLGICASPAQAASFADLSRDWKDVSLLNGRLGATVPGVAELVPPIYSITEAPQPPERELRIMVGAGASRLVAVVTELFRVASVDLAGPGKAYIKTIEEQYRFDELAVAPRARIINGLEVLEYEARGKATVPGANMINGLLIRQADGSLQSIAFFINDEGMPDVAAARQIVTRVIASLKPGSRGLVSGARLRLEGTNLTLDLPKEYTAYAQRGPDFTIYWIEHLATIGSPAGRMGIYAGPHPQRPDAPATARSVSTTLFGVNAEWKAWEQARQQGTVLFRRQEAFIQRQAAGPDWLHVFLYAVSDYERAVFQRIAETASFQ
jgi:hypothetical protein